MSFARRQTLNVLSLLARHSQQTNSHFKLAAGCVASLRQACGDPQQQHVPGVGWNWQLSRQITQHSGVQGLLDTEHAGGEATGCAGSCSRQAAIHVIQRAAAVHPHKWRSRHRGGGPCTSRLACACWRGAAFQWHSVPQTPGSVGAGVQDAADGPGTSSAQPAGRGAGAGADGPGAQAPAQHSQAVAALLAVGRLCSALLPAECLHLPDLLGAELGRHGTNWLHAGSDIQLAGLLLLPCYTWQLLRLWAF